MSNVITISLTEELKELVAAKVRSGRYGNASEVIREALRNWEAGDEHEDAELEALIEAGRKTPLLDWSKDLVGRGPRANRRTQSPSAKARTRKSR